MRTLIFLIGDEKSARKYADQLVGSSKWFMVLPLPGDEWEFTVKDESGTRPGPDILYCTCAKLPEADNHHPDCDLWDDRAPE